MQVLYSDPHSSSLCVFMYVIISKPVVRLVISVRYEIWIVEMKVFQFKCIRKNLMND